MVYTCHFLKGYRTFFTLSYETLSCYACTISCYSGKYTAIQKFGIGKMCFTFNLLIV